jgi:hypothetical protein
MAAKAVALSEASQPAVEHHAAAVVDNARVLAEALVARGVPVVTGGKDNHLVLVDVRPFGRNGRQAEAALRAAGITLKRNVVPDETNGAWYTSGLRLGTPAVSTLGMGADEIREIADVLTAVLAATSAGASNPDPSRASPRWCGSGSTRLRPTPPDPRSPTSLAAHRSTPKSSCDHARPISRRRGSGPSHGLADPASMTTKSEPITE